MADDADKWAAQELLLPFAEQLQQMLAPIQSMPDSDITAMMRTCMVGATCGGLTAEAASIVHRELLAEWVRRHGRGE